MLTRGEGKKTLKEEGTKPQNTHTQHRKRKCKFKLTNFPELLSRIGGRKHHNPFSEKKKKSDRKAPKVTSSGLKRTETLARSFSAVIQIDVCISFRGQATSFVSIFRFPTGWTGIIDGIEFLVTARPRQFSAFVGTKCPIQPFFPFCPVCHTEPRLTVCNTRRG